MLVMSRLFVVEQSRTMARRRGRGFAVEDRESGDGWLGSDQRRSCGGCEHSEETGDL